jgi:hypothetical protein
MEAKPAFGQIRPLERPFGSGRATVRNGEMAARRCRQDDLATKLICELRLLSGPIAAS